MTMTRRAFTSGLTRRYWTGAASGAPDYGRHCVADSQDNNSAQLEALRSEVEALRAENAELSVFRDLAYRDPLTGLWNRRYLDERLREEIERALRQDDPRFSVLLVDLNDFKRINDEHGHGTGDECLKFVARFLESHLRDHDICCRTGGDEFTVILPEANAQGAERLIRRLREQLMRCNTSRSLPVQLSVGSATWPVHGRQPDRLLTHADGAMSADKSRQRGGRAARGARRDVTLPWMGLGQLRE